MNCTNHNMVFVKRIKINGQKLLNKQCLCCGEKDSIAYKLSLVNDFDALPFFSDELLEQYYSRELNERKNIIEEQKKEWFKNYNLYLQSPEWKAKRLKVLKRDNWTCQSCLEREANEVHHTTYEHVFNEPCFELVSICIKCHDKLTELNRNK